MLYDLARSFLFSFDPETAHEAAIATLHAVGAVLPPAPPKTSSPIEVMGLVFPNRIGLAAGLDKNGKAIDGLAWMGFGFIEIGTVTPRAQPGNPKPRLFRLPQAQAIVNRMGFNNYGVDVLAANVRAAKYKGILGINIGKNIGTPMERAADDYIAALEKVYELASYVVINVSSPNTKNLRQLQGTSKLDELLGKIKIAQNRLAGHYGRYVPLALKIAPDLDFQAVADIADVVRRHRIDAVIATNTTLARDKVAGQPFADQLGGLSGAPLLDTSTGVLRQLAQELSGEIPLIASGGVMDGAAARAKIEAGATLVQMLSGLIYRGPGLVRECMQATADF